ncbi:MAG: cell division protein ZapE [Proteobacteria bacterium]|nr:cell division protein ZapE [Pseudomonadota bacterium]
MTTISESYLQLLEREGWQADPVQSAAVERFAELEKELAQFSRCGGRFFSRIVGKGKRPTPKGLYLWGGVGRGKSILMDLFYQNIESVPKKRVHFHAFMLDVHARVFQLRRDPSNNGDPLKEVAKQIATETTLLCFDEFQVTDTADAMILSRLFKKMFERDVIVVATSNRPPLDLYLGGLNRDLFLPFVDMLIDRSVVSHLDGAKDYRLEQLRSIGVFHTPLGPTSDSELAAAFHQLTGRDRGDPLELRVQGRSLTVQSTASGAGQMTFAELCERPLGSADYLAIAETFNTLIVSGIPLMGPEKRNEAKRFTTLIDALYEHRVNLICSADAAPDQLYPDGHGSFEFARTVSRLMEMQSPDYMALAHIVTGSPSN